MQLQMHDGPKILQKHKNSCLASKCYKNLQHFEKVIQMHVEDTKNKNFYYYWVPSKPPTITVRVCEDHKIKCQMKKLT